MQAPSWLRSLSADSRFGIERALRVDLTEPYKRVNRSESFNSLENGHVTPEALNRLSI